MKLHLVIKGVYLQSRSTMWNDTIRCLCLQLCTCCVHPVQCH